MAHKLIEGTRGTELHVKPEGFIDTIVFEPGLWQCGDADDGMSVHINSNAGGVFTNADLRAIKNRINEHLRAVKARSHENTLNGKRTR